MCVSMESPGVEVAKRQRLDSQGTSFRLPPPGQEGLSLHDYSNPGILHSLSAYSHTPISTPGYPPTHPSSLTHLPLRDQQQSYEQRNGPFSTPNSDRLPPVDTNPLHGVGIPPGSYSPRERSSSTLRPIDTTFPETQSYVQHPSMQDASPVYPPQGPPPHPPPTQSAGVYHPQHLPMAQVSYDQGQSHSSGPSYTDVHGGPFSAGPYGPQGHVPWRSGYSGNQPPNLPQPKKGSRAIQACESCRQRKAKCDEGKPTCSNCNESRVACVYKEMQPAKADRAQREIMEAFKTTNECYHSLREDISKLSEQFHEAQSNWNALGTIASFLQTLKTSDHVSPGNGSLKDMSLLDMLQSYGASQAVEESKLSRSQTAENVTAKSDKRRLLAAGHTVMAHRLLGWESIKELLAGKSLEDDYVMALEERKGLVRIYGRGQGKDSYDGAATNENTASPASSVSDDAAPRSPHDAVWQNACWGDPSLGLPNIVDGHFFQNEKHHLGGLTKDGGLQLDKNTMLSLMECYLAHMHILHPILDSIRLRRMVEKVWRDYNPAESAANKSPFPSDTSYQRSGQVMKRKYSVGGTATEERKSNPTTNGVHGPASQHLPRRPATVIVLLVMALGKICQYKDPLPGFAPTTDGLSSSQSKSPTASSFPSPYPSELRGIAGHRMGAGAGMFNTKGMRKGDRNVDVVPGLAYFAMATNILGGLQGNDLIYAQAYLLAALYTAQLACVLESWTWINHASRVCWFLVRDPSFSKETDTKRVDLIRFVYYASLQMESDILAEFDLQPSVLQDIDPDGKIGVPNGVVEDAIDVEFTSRPGDVPLYYSYQLSLRKCMNEWQRYLYPVPDDNSDSQNDNETHGNSKLLANKKMINPEGEGNFSIHDRNLCGKMLAELRTLMQKHPELQWEETDDPSSYINAARLRGKYYGAKYLIHRPFLRFALHNFNRDNLNPRVMQKWEDFQRNPSSSVLEDEEPTNMSLDDLIDWWSFQILLSCYHCVEAAKKSTLAFDGVLQEQRLMVTNLFGTAHAQFGNMLVLSAVFSSRLLDFLIDKQEFKQLLERTIQFLDSLAPISTTLAKDCELLIVIREKLENGFKINDNKNPGFKIGDGRSPGTKFRRRRR